MEYREVQQIAKDTIAYAKRVINPGMNLLQVRKLCEQKMLELGADSFWYWDIGAFVFAGDETTISVSGKQYITSNRTIAENDIITIDLSPQNGNIWGDYARTIIIENGVVVDKADVCNEEQKARLERKIESERSSYRYLNSSLRETEEELADVKEQLPWWKKKRKKKLKLYYYKKHWWKSDKFKENVVMGIMLAGYICVVWWLFKWSLG